MEAQRVGTDSMCRLYDAVFRRTTCHVWPPAALHWLFSNICNAEAFIKLHLDVQAFINNRGAWNFKI